MSRDVPFDDDDVCDSCGQVGVFDFMGDSLCPECAMKRTDDSIAVEVATHQGFWDWFSNKAKERLNERIKHDTGLPDKQTSDFTEEPGVQGKTSDAGDV